MQQILKPEYNEEYRLVEFARPDGNGQLAAGETVVSASALCLDGGGNDVTSTMVLGVTPNGLTQVRYLLRGGEVGKTYRLYIRVETSGGQKLEEPFILRIFDL